MITNALYTYFFLFVYFCKNIDTPHYFFFFFNDTATTEIYTLSLHDALPIYRHRERKICERCRLSLAPATKFENHVTRSEEHTSESSHGYISYAVFCLKKKKYPCHGHFFSALKAHASARHIACTLPALS